MMSEYITLISTPENPTDFITQYDTTIALNNSYEVGLTSIFHGNVCNVCDGVNFFYIASYAASTTSSTFKVLPRNISRLTVPSGFYKTTRSLIDAMKISIDAFVKSGGKDGSWFSATDVTSELTSITYTSKNKSERRTAPIGPNDLEVTTINLELAHNQLRFYQPSQGPNTTTLLSLLGKGGGLFDVISIANSEMPSADEIGLVYCSLVKSSRLNNRNTNLLAIIPLARGTTEDYTYHSVIHPTYFPVSVNSFERIRIQIKNVLDEPVHIQHMHKRTHQLYPTIITLHIRQKVSINTSPEYLKLNHDRNI